MNQSRNRFIIFFLSCRFVSLITIQTLVSEFLNRLKAPDMVFIIKVIFIMPCSFQSSVTHIENDLFHFYDDCVYDQHNHQSLQDHCQTYASPKQHDERVKYLEPSPSIKFPQSSRYPIVLETYLRCILTMVDFYNIIFFHRHATAQELRGRGEPDRVTSASEQSPA